jgi:hypothetical protein
MTLFEKITYIGNRAVEKAQKRNTRKGIANVYAVCGKPVFLLPDGKITTKYKFKL